MKTRRSALSYLTGGAVATGALLAGGGLMRSCQPSASILAEEDAQRIQPPETGRSVILLGGTPILIRRLADHESDVVAELIESEETGLRRLIAPPVTDRQTAKYPLVNGSSDLFVISLSCPRRGCVVMQDAGDWGGEGGFFCPCYGAHFDGLGRIRKGPAARNLFIPRARLLADGEIEFRNLSGPMFVGGEAI